MSEIIGLFDNLASAWLLASIFVLVRQNNHGFEPYHRPITLGYLVWGLSAFMLTLTSITGVNSGFTEEITVISKLSSAFTLSIVVLRLERIYAGKVFDAISKKNDQEDV